MILNNECNVKSKDCDKQEKSNEKTKQEGGIALNNKSEIKNDLDETEKLKRKSQEQSNYSDYIWIPLSILALGYLDYNYSNIFLGASDDLDHTLFQHFFDYCKKEDHIKENNKEYSLEDYIQNPRFSKGFAQVNEYICRLFPSEKGKCSYDKASYDKQISSLRGQPGNKLTDVEKWLDEIVDKGDLPIQQFTMKQIDDLKKNYPKPENGQCIIKDTYFDALYLYRHFPDESIVQVASQFNALESPVNLFYPVMFWIQDLSQGPRAAVQAVASAKHRESAYLKGKLPDMLTNLINEFEGKENIKFPDYFYKEGYLQLFVGEPKDNLKNFKDNMENFKDNLKKFSEFLKGNIGNLGFNAQWTLCGPQGKRQFQVFSAAPSFQNYAIDWNKDEGKDKNEIKQVYREICETLVVAQYKAIAQVACIRSVLTGKRQTLVLTSVGQGFFGNPPSVLEKAKEVVTKEVEGYNVDVVWNNKSG